MEIMIRDDIRKSIEKAIKELGFKVPEVLVENSREKNHGDYATNVAIVIGKEDPMKIAETIKSKIKSNIIDKIEIAKPGFINFFVSKEFLQKQVGEILKKKEKFADLKIGKGQKVNVEFISANPTGPLTLGNGRGGFCGDVLSNVLEKAGYNVTREYYLNDRGKQVEDLKKGLYKGETRTASQIQKANQKFIIEDMKIKFDVWFSEKSLYKNKEVDKVLGYFKKKKLTYKEEGALWFKSTKFGDDKDRVLIKEGGDYTYLASDIAYLKNKFDRKFDKLIYFLGADHYGYIGRMKAAAEALGYKKEQVDFIIMQMVAVMWAGDEGPERVVKMSKREGIFRTINELIEGLGLDVVRFFFLMRSSGSHLTFNLDLAKERSDKNPVYYVQYAHARICSILRKTKIRPDIKSLNELKEKPELDLIKQLIRFEEIIEDTAKDYQVQRIPQYAIHLAESFHKFYKNCRVLTDDKKLSQARLSLILASRVLLKNTLNLMGISAPEKM